MVAERRADGDSTEVTRACSTVTQYTQSSLEYKV
jgi:hypothetical protein